MLTLDSRVRLKRSGRYLQGLRDAWQAAGREPEKSRAKIRFEEAYRLIGTIEEMDDNASPGMSINVTVRWDHGGIQFTTISALEQA